MVVGASVAGLLAARVLADAFDRVTVLDRDSLPDEPVARRGVPQARHPHVLLEAGRATLADLFPGYGEELLSAGGLVIDWTRDANYYDEGGYIVGGSSRRPMFCASRPLFEATLRRRVADLDAVSLRTDCQVTDYRIDDDGTTVEGVTVRDGSAEEALGADLVVDATGRTSNTPEWLASQGYPTPAVEEVRVDVAYSTATVERPPDDRRLFLAAPSHPRTRAGGVIPVEGNRWLVTMQGVHGDDPPTDREGLVEYAGSLPIPGPQRVLAERPWCSESVERYPFPSSRRRRYERLDRFPDGLLVVGDAVASFNPIYGQGMSVAALEALQLHHALAADGEDDLPRRFFDRAGEVVDVAWLLSVGADFEFPQTTGPKPRGTDLFNRYVARLLRTAHTDGVVSNAFSRVVMMEEPPTALLRPGVLWRVLRPMA